MRPSSGSGKVWSGEAGGWSLCPADSGLGWRERLGRSSRPAGAVARARPLVAASPVEGLPNPLPEIAARVNGQPIRSLAVATRARDLLIREKVPKGQTAVAFRRRSSI